MIFLNLTNETEEKIATVFGIMKTQFFYAQDIFHVLHDILRYLWIQMSNGDASKHVKQF